MSGEAFFVISIVVHRRSFFFSLFLSSNTVLPKEFQYSIYDRTTVQKRIVDISIYYRTKIMHAATRRAALFVVARYGEGDLSVFPRDVLKLIAKEVWKTRRDEAWLDASE